MQREALTAAYVRIILRYVLAGTGGLGYALAQDPDVILIVTAGVAALLEAYYIRDWIKRGRP